MNWKLSTVVLVVFFLCTVSTGYAAVITGEAQIFSTYSLNTGNLDYGTSLRLKWNPSLSNQYYFKADVLLKYKDENNYSPIRWNEFYIQGVGTPADNIDFKLGYFQLTWGASDMFSPVDNVNPRPFAASLSKDSSDDKIPILGLDLEWYVNNDWSIEIVYQPAFESDFIPAYVEKQLLGYQIAPATGLNPSTMTINYQAQNPVVSFTDPIWAVRARGKVGNVDTAVSFYKGYFLSPFPYQTEVTVNQDGSSTANVDVGYPGKKVLGLEFQGEIPGVDGVTFRGDVALIIPEHWANRISTHQGDGTTTLTTVDIFDQPYWKASLGFDYTADDKTYYNLIFMLGNPYEEGQDVSPYLFLRLEKPSKNDKWKPYLNSALSIEDGSMLNVLGVDYKPQDNWTVSFTYSIASGGSTTKLGRAGSALSLGIRYVF